MHIHKYTWFDWNIAIGNWTECLLFSEGKLFHDHWIASFTDINSKCCWPSEIQWGKYVSLANLNPIPHCSGRIYSHFLQRPIAWQGAWNKNIEIFAIPGKNALTLYLQKVLYLYTWYRPRNRLSPKKCRQKHLPKWYS